MILKCLIALLAKTSHAVYSEMPSVFLLTSLSYVLHKTRELVGKQESTIGGTQTATIQSIHRELIKNDNIIIRSFLTFDNMQLQHGIGWDINQKNLPA